MNDSDERARLAAATGPIPQASIQKRPEFYTGEEHEIRFNDLPDVLRESVWRFVKERLGAKWQNLDTAERNAAIQTALDSVLIPAVKRRIGASVWEEANSPKKLDFLRAQLSRPETQTEPEVPQVSARQELEMRTQERTQQEQEDERSKLEELKLKMEQERMKLEKEVSQKYHDLLEGEKNPTARQEALKRLVELERSRMPKPAPVQPAPPAERPIAVPERKLAIMDKDRWLRWYSEAFSQEQFDILTSQFVPELAKTLQKDRPTNQELEVIRGLYQNILLQMYTTKNPGRTSEEYRSNIQSWMDGRWNDILAAAQRFPPIG